MATYFADDFNRADGAVGANWTTSVGANAPQIVSNEVDAVDDFVAYSAWWNADTTIDDQFAELDVTIDVTASGYCDCGVFLRHQSGVFTASACFWEYTGNVSIWRVTAGAWGSPLVTTSGQDTSGTKTLRMEATGTSLVGYLDGVEVVDYTEGTALTGGAPGIGVYKDPGGDAQIDNFSAGDYLGKSLISDTMRSYTDTQLLDAQTGWTVENVSGSGVMTSDKHAQHAHYLANKNQVVDMSTAGHGLAIWDADTLDSDDQTAEVGIFFDNYTANDNPNATGSLCLRYDGVSVGRDESGYKFEVLSEGGVSGPYFFAYIKRIDSGVSTTIASDQTGTINESDEERIGVVRLTFKAVGSTLTGYINGREVISTTDTTHTGETHRYTGWGLNRVESASHSQPFGTNFAAWTPNCTNQAYTEYLGGTINTGDNGSVTPPTTTATNSLDAAAGEQLFAVIQIRDANQDETPGVTSLTDDGSDGSDDFNRADEALETSSNWIAGHLGTAGNMEIVSNVVQGNAITTFEAQRWATAAGASDHFAEADLTTIGGGGYNEAGLLVRATPGSSDGMLLTRTTDSGGIYYLTEYPSQSNRWTSAGSQGTGTKTCRLEASGTTYTVYEDGVSIGSYTGSTLTGTSVGISEYHTIATGEFSTVDNFSTGGIWTLETSQVDVGNQVGYFVYSKTAAGDETLLSLVTDTASVIVMETYRFPSGWAYETAAWDSNQGAAVTGTLSSDSKLGLAISGTATNDGYGVAFVDGDFDRPIQVGMPSFQPTSVSEAEPVHGSALHDLGTATTAFTVAGDVTTAASTVGAIVLAKVPPPAGPLWTGDFSGSGAYVDADTNVLAATWITGDGDLQCYANYDRSSIEIDGPTFRDFQWMKITYDGYTGGTGLDSGVLALNQTATGTLNPNVAGNGYSLFLRNEGDTSSEWSLWRDSVLVANLGTRNLAVGDVMELRGEENGSSVDVSFWVNGAQFGSTYTDSSPLTGGHPAFGWYTYNSGGQTYVHFSAASAGDDRNQPSATPIAASFSAYAGTLTVSGTGILSVMTDTGLVPV